MPNVDQGILKDRYSVVPRSLIFLTCGDKVLLQKGSPDKKIWAGLYNGIGGHIERNEDPLTSARRELNEETGITQVDITLKGIITIDTYEQMGVLIFVFHGESESTLTKPNQEGTLEWLSLPEIFDLPLVEDLPYLLPKVLEADSGEKLFYGHYFYNMSGELVTNFS